VIDAAALRQTDLLARCGESDLEEVLARSSEVTLDSGNLLFSEDDRAAEVWVLLEGELVITKISDGAEVIIDELAPGAFLGEISLLTGTPAGQRARARGPGRVLRIPADVFHSLLRSCTAVTETVLRTMAERVRGIEHMLAERERMAGLGTIAAGLAHELNNPAAAVHRAITVLATELDALDPIAQRLASHQWSDADVELFSALASEARTHETERAHVADALEREDRAEALCDWLTGRGVECPPVLAAALAGHGVTVERLAALAGSMGPVPLGDALEWTHRMVAIRELLADAGRSAARITELVRAVKAFSYKDTTTLRVADVHEGIDHTLTMLGHKLRDGGARVIREYDRSLPPVDMYGTELHQVWTNLLDNAADAVAGRKGIVRLRTAMDGDGVRIDVIDDGPGIPSDLQPRIFDPFVTTKAAGKGTGLGLEIAKRIVDRHHGRIEVASSHDETRFSVTLPVRQPTGAATPDSYSSDPPGRAEGRREP